MIIQITHVEAFVAGGADDFSCVAALGFDPASDRYASVGADGRVEALTRGEYRNRASKLLELAAPVFVKPGEAVSVIGPDQASRLRLMRISLVDRLRTLLQNALYGEMQFGIRVSAVNPIDWNELRAVVEWSALEAFDHLASSFTPGSDDTGLRLAWETVEVSTCIDDEAVFVRGAWISRFVHNDDETAEKHATDAVLSRVFTSDLDFELAVANYHDGIRATYAPGKVINIEVEREAWQRDIRIAIDDYDRRSQERDEKNQFPTKEYGASLEWDFPPSAAGSPLPPVPTFASMKQTMGEFNRPEVSDEDGRIVENHWLEGSARN